MAFFSGTDNRSDEGAIGFSGVVGNIKPDSYSTVWRFNYRDKKLDCDFDDIFALPTREAQEVPAEWIEKINTPSYNFNYGGNSTKGKADHLKPYQFPKGGKASVVSAGEGNRMGPHLQDQRRLLPDDSNEADSFGVSRTGGFDWDTWGYDPSLMVEPDENIILDLLGNRQDERLSAAERALALLNEDPDYDRSHLAAQAMAYDPMFDPDVVNQETGEVLKPSLLAFSGDDRFEEIEAEHGKEVAEVFCLIDDSMSYLNGKDELVENLMSDMIHMMSDEGQENLFKRLFQELPDKAQERIQMNGIH
jgi:hypothetical protein